MSDLKKQIKEKKELINRLQREKSELEFTDNISNHSHFSLQMVDRTNGNMTHINIDGPKELKIFFKKVIDLIK